MEAVLAIFAEIDDPRDHTAQYELPALLFIALAATLCGARSCVDIADFAAANRADLADIIDLPADATPSETAPPRSDRHRRHRRPAETTDPIAACTPPRPSTDPTAPQHPAPNRADQPPHTPQQTAAKRGLQATLPDPAHGRHPRAQATSNYPTPTGTYNY